MSVLSRVDKRTVRLVASANHKPPVLQRLAQSEDALVAIERLESVTSGRRVAQQQGVPGISPQALAQGFGYTYINAAFAYPRPAGNRFNPTAWGAWYSAFRVDTALHEISFHLTRALWAAGGEFRNTTHYVELRASFHAEFHDLRGVEPVPECLHADTSRGYPAGQALAIELRRDGVNGIVYPSVRHSGGTCLVAFWPGLVRDFGQGDGWKLVWAGGPTPSMTKASRAR